MFGAPTYNTERVKAVHGLVARIYSKASEEFDDYL